MIDIFLRSCADAFLELAVTDVQSEGAQRFADAVRSAEPKPFEASWLPALDSSPALDDTALARQFSAVAPQLPWSATTRTTDEGREMALCFLADMFTLDGVTAGLTYVDAHRAYPEHNHPPQEIYLTISGTADWRWGGAETTAPVGPNEVLYNHPHDWHSMTTGDQPLAALWVLWES